MKFEPLVGIQMLLYCVHSRLGFGLACVASDEGKDPFTAITDLIVAANVRRKELEAEKPQRRRRPK
jgi:hypothetical protein